MRNQNDHLDLKIYLKSNLYESTKVVNKRAFHVRNAQHLPPIINHHQLLYSLISHIKVSNCKTTCVTAGTAGSVYSTTCAYVSIVSSREGVRAQVQTLSGKFE